MIRIRVARAFDQLQVRVAFEQYPQSNLQFQPGQRGAHAEMQSAAKAAVDLYWPRWVKMIRIFPPRRVALSRAQNQRHLIAAR